MTSVVNPYAADPDPAKPEVWEMGYLVGFQDPGASDFEPYVPLPERVREVARIRCGRDGATAVATLRQVRRGQEPHRGSLSAPVENSPPSAV
jgi:hypothetical protein